MNDRQNGCGIFDEFPGYRLPSDREKDSALHNALVVLDANVLLNLYRYNDSTRDDLFEVLRGFGDRLWVPHQAMREFWRNRLGVLTSRGSSTTQVLAALSKQHRATTDALLLWTKTTAIEDSEREALLKRVDDMHERLETAIQAHAPNASLLTSSYQEEPVLQRLKDLLAGKVGSALDDADWQAAVKEGNERATRQEPPGYLDAEKANSDLPEGAAGDYLVWHQALRESTKRDLDLLLITGDEKEDWWWRYRSDLLGPRAELTTELRQANGRRLFLMRPIDLLKRAATLKVKVRDESVTDVDRVRKETETQPVWTRTGVLELLERLESEGWEHGEVIVAAAKNGGTIDRSEVYEICGYSDDRMLRGFTRPSSRITSVLQGEGLVAEGVEPPLTPLYHGDVKAGGFRIPAEMVAILGSTSDEPLSA
jgi:hypothetical protein